MAPAIYWTRERIVHAIRAWTAREGRPPTAAHWARTAVEHPTHATVKTRFGSWSAALRAAKG